MGPGRGGGVGWVVEIEVSKECTLIPGARCDPGRGGGVGWVVELEVSKECTLIPGARCGPWTGRRGRVDCGD